MSRHTVVGGDIGGLVTRLIDLREKARARTGKLYPMVVVQEAGLERIAMSSSIRRRSGVTGRSVGNVAMGSSSR